MGLFLEGLIYGGKFEFQNRLGWPYSSREIYLFCFVLLCISTSPREGFYSEGRFNGGFLRYEFGGLIFRGAYFPNFTVITCS